MCLMQSPNPPSSVQLIGMETPIEGYALFISEVYNHFNFTNMRHMQSSAKFSAGTRLLVMALDI